MYAIEAGIKVGRTDRLICTQAVHNGRSGAVIVRGFEVGSRYPARMSSGADPLSDGEYDALADLLEAHGVLDIEALLGLLNAVTVAPDLITRFPTEIRLNFHRKLDT